MWKIQERDNNQGKYYEVVDFDDWRPRRDEDKIVKVIRWIAEMDEEIGDWLDENGGGLSDDEIWDDRHRMFIGKKCRNGFYSSDRFVFYRLADAMYALMLLS